MNDSRFETLARDTADLLHTVTVGDLGEFETLLMVLLQRPVEVRNGVDGPNPGPALEVILDWQHGFFEPYPFSLLHLVRECLDLATDLATHSADDSADDRPALAGLGDAALVRELQQALGLARLLPLLDDAED